MTDKEKVEMERDLIIPRHIVNNQLQSVYEAGFLAGSMGSKVLPHPCNGEMYKDCGPFGFLCKIAEEYNEVVQASLEYKKEYKAKYYPADDESSFCRIKDAETHLAMECTDLIVAVTSYMEKLGFDEKARQQYMRQVNWSNSQRDGGKRFKDNPWHYAEEEQREIQEEIERDKD